MHLNYLEFERPIAELKAKIAELKQLESESDVNISEEITRLEQESDQLTRSIFSDLNTIQVVQLARHPLRPYTQEYISTIFSDFDELHGDRHYSSGHSIIAGMARLNGQPVMVMGHQNRKK